MVSKWVITYLQMGYNIGVKTHLLLGCPWKLVTIVSKLGYNLFRGRIQPTYIGVK